MKLQVESDRGWLFSSSPSFCSHARLSETFWVVWRLCCGYCVSRGGHRAHARRPDSRTAVHCFMAGGVAFVALDRSIGYANVVLEVQTAVLPERPGIYALELP